MQIFTGPIRKRIWETDSDDPPTRRPLPYHPGSLDHVPSELQPHSNNSDSNADTPTYLRGTLRAPSVPRTGLRRKSSTGTGNLPGNRTTLLGLACLAWLHIPIGTRDLLYAFLPCQHPLEVESEPDVLINNPHDPGARPPYSYRDVIRQAIEESPGNMLTVAEIRDAIENRYPYFRTADVGWKKSIRSALSTQKGFKRRGRAANEPGKGYFWVIDYTSSNIPSRVSSPDSTIADTGETSAPAGLQVKLSLSDQDSHLLDLERSTFTASGGFCEVYVASHRPTNIKLAMKRPRMYSPTPDMLRRFRREA